MKRLVAALAVVLAGCAGGAPTPQLIRGTTTEVVTVTAERTVTAPAEPPITITAPAPTPQVIYVTPAPTTVPPTAGAIGDTIRAGDWTVRVNGLVIGTSGNQFIKPDPGNVYWIADLTMTNEGTEVVSAGSGWRLRDDQEFTYDADLFAIREPRLGGDVAPGATTRGYLAYEVPKGRTPVALLFQAETFGGDILTVTVP